MKTRKQSLLPGPAKPELTAITRVCGHGARIAPGVRAADRSVGATPARQR